MALAITVRSCSRTFGRGRRSCRAMDGINLEVAKGEMVALIGASGSGKSTLLRHIAGLLRCDADGGSIAVHGDLVQDQRGVVRQIRRVRSRVGFVFQQFNLVGRLSLLGNVLVGMVSRLPSWRSLSMWYTQEEKQRAMAALHRVGIAGYAAQRASTLSGGQQQRAAIARALVQGAELILGDEPIASLDPESSRRVMECLTRINQEDGVTVVVSLHQVEIARAFCPRTVALRAGRVVYDGATAELTDERLREIYGAELEQISTSARKKSAPSLSNPVLQPV
jgi:phosphonate transport system ATP-binding protein